MTDIRLARPYFSYGEVERDFRAIFESGMFTRGQHVTAFCDELKSYTGARHAVLATSATTALWICLKLLGIGPGDEVAVSDFSFPASANVIEDLGARPIFVDVLPDTFNMDPADLIGKIGPASKAVMFVDALGSPAGLHEIKRICQQHGVPLIEDAACAIGSTEHGRRCGSIADLTCFSFHPRKLLNTGEGGAITTDRDDWAEWLRIKLMHGADGMRGIGADFVDYGYNFRLPELQAVMGRKQLPRLDAIIAQRQAVRDAYTAQLEPLGFVAQATGADVSHNVQSLVFRTPDGVNRDELVLALREQGIETTLGTYCLSGTTYFRYRYDTVQPIAAMLEQRTITLPCYDGVPVDLVADAIRRLVKRP